MRLIVLFAACATMLGIATTVAAEDVDHSAHHPAEATKPAAAPAKPTPALTAKPENPATTSIMATPNKMQCMAMMSDNKSAVDAKKKPGMSAEQHQHCMQMMSQMTPAAAAQPAAK